jgi:membrane-associated phospholipid phosphatase
MRELERRSEALVSAGDSAHLTPLDSNELARNESTGVESVRGELARLWASLGAFEWVALGYLLLSSAMILAFPKNLARTNVVHPWKLIGAQAIVATFIFLLCSVAARAAERAQLEGVRRTQYEGVILATRFWHFWRSWYPHLFFLFCFEELAYLVHLVNPNWQDAKLIAFDHWMFGVHPAVWLEQFATPVRNEFIQLAYLTYFVYLVVLGGILYYRKEWHAYWSVMTYSAVAYAIGYVIAMLFPIESPWFAMAGMWHGELHGGPFTATINFIEHYGRVRGAAFPSEHVAGSVAALWGAWRFRRWLFWVMLPLIAAMCVSTVWGRYHYVADIFGGIVTGTLGYVIGWRIMDRAARTVFSNQSLQGKSTQP